MIELTQQEKEAVKLFVEDAVTYPTVQKVMLDSIEKELENTLKMIRLNISSVSDEKIGQNVRACEYGAHLIRKLFSELVKYKEVVPKETKPMRGR